MSGVDPSEPIFTWPAMRSLLLRSYARGRKAHAGLLFGQCDEFGERTDTERGVNGQHNRLARQLYDRRERLQRVDPHLERMRCTGDDVRRDQNRIAVRRARGRALDTDEAAASRLVFHHDLLAERTRQK